MSEQPHELMMLISYRVRVCVFVHDRAYYREKESAISDMWMLQCGLAAVMREMRRRFP